MIWKVKILRWYNESIDKKVKIMIKKSRFWEKLKFCDILVNIFRWNSPKDDIKCGNLEINMNILSSYLITLSFYLKILTLYWKKKSQQIQVFNFYMWASINLQLDQLKGEFKYLFFGAELHEVLIIKNNWPVLKLMNLFTRLVEFKVIFFIDDFLKLLFVSSLNFLIHVRQLKCHLIPDFVMIIVQ